MKTKLLAKFFLPAFFSIGILNFAHSQSITVVGNEPIPGFDYETTGNGNLFGYDGNQVVLNDTLYGQFQTVTSDLESNGSGTYYLCKYDDGNTVSLIANPDNSPGGVYPNTVKIVFDNKIFFIYINAQNIQQLASFDGKSITLYPNPDGGLGFVGSLRDFNNVLYLAYSNAAGAFQIGKFNGTGITLFPNPDNSTVGFNFDYMNYFNGKIIARYQNASTGTVQLASYQRHFLDLNSKS